MEENSFFLRLFLDMREPDSIVYTKGEDIIPASDDELSTTTSRNVIFESMGICIYIPKIHSISILVNWILLYRKDYIVWNTNAPFCHCV